MFSKSSLLTFHLDHCRLLGGNSCLFQFILLSANRLTVLNSSAYHAQNPIVAPQCPPHTTQIFKALHDLDLTYHSGLTSANLPHVETPT